MPGILRVALVCEFNQGFSEGVLRGIASFARPPHAWSFRHFAPRRAAVRALAEWKPHGIIAMPADREVALALRSIRAPRVLTAFFEHDPEAPFVINDDDAIGVLAARHFLERGFRQCAFIGWPFLAFADGRERGFRRTIEAAGGTCSIYTAGTGLGRERWYGGGAAPERSIARWLAALPKPIAVLAGNDHRAWQVARLCRQAGIRVPEELALLGVDDSETVCQLADPPLSSVRTGAELIGQRAAAMLERLMHGGAHPANQRIPPLGVTVRRSSEIFAVDDARVAAALQAIAAHAHRPLSVEDVAARVAVPRRTLEKRFRAVLGRSVMDEVRRVRLDRARTLLATTTLPMGEIAGRCGFADAKQFTQTFARVVGIPPSQHRRQAAAR